MDLRNIMDAPPRPWCDAAGSHERVACGHSGRMAKISKRVALPQVTPLPRCALHLEFHGVFAHTDLQRKPAWQK